MGPRLPQPTRTITARELNEKMQDGNGNDIHSRFGKTSDPKVFLDRAQNYQPVLLQEETAPY